MFLTDLRHELESSSEPSNSPCGIKRDEREMAVLMYVASQQVYQRAALCILQPSEVSDLRGPLPSKETSERIHEICSATEADHGQTEPRYHTADV